MATLTEFGKKIKWRLIDIDQTDLWLVERVKEKTGLYFDSSYLYKIRTGKLANQKIVTAIREILGLEMP